MKFLYFPEKGRDVSDLSHKKGRGRQNRRLFLKKGGTTSSVAFLLVVL